MKILIADDHDIVRFGLQQLLAQAFPNLECSEAATGQGVLDKIEDKRWDVVILDLTLPDIHGLEVTRISPSPQPCRASRISKPPIMTRAPPILPSCPSMSTRQLPSM